MPVKIKEEDGWSLKLYTDSPLPETSSEVSHYMSQEPKVLELFNEISAALRNKQELDLTNYLEFWKQWDKCFGAYIGAVFE